MGTPAVKLTPEQVRAKMPVMGACQSTDCYNEDRDTHPATHVICSGDYVSGVPMCQERADKVVDTLNAEPTENHSWYAVKIRD